MYDPTSTVDVNQTPPRQCMARHRRALESPLSRREAVIQSPLSNACHQAIVVRTRDTIAISAAVEGTGREKRMKIVFYPRDQSRVTGMQRYLQRPRMHLPPRLRLILRLNEGCQLTGFIFQVHVLAPNSMVSPSASCRASRQWRARLRHRVAATLANWLLESLFDFD